MADSFVMDDTIKILAKAMDVTTKRHGLITANIANIDTVGYRPKDIDFKKTLALAMDGNQGARMAGTHPKHLSGGYSVKLSDAARSGADASPESADIDREMTHLAENNIKFRSSLEMLLRKMQMLKHTIAEGGR